MEPTRNLAVFCDFENIAIGVRDAKHANFEIGLVLERLLDKGKIVVKKAYADWESYKTFKRDLHEAAFEMIEIPHVSFSGKNSADIRLVVDALDLCYTKSHVDTFVIMSGDSDFSPLVSKLRENDKQVIGLGVRNSTSDLLVDNCDDFIYYDDLVKKKKGPSRRGIKKAAPVKPPEVKGKKPDQSAIDAEAVEELKLKALNLVLEIVEALFEEREDNPHASVVKQTLKRKRPNFSESAHGYRSFSGLLQDASKRGLLEIQKDQRSGGYVITAFGKNA
jgi:uncharacterized protein (TIGR00288 family)